MGPLARRGCEGLRKSAGRGWEERSDRVKLHRVAWDPGNDATSPADVAQRRPSLGTRRPVLPPTGPPRFMGPSSGEEVVPVAFLGRSDPLHHLLGREALLEDQLRRMGEGGGL